MYGKKKAKHGVLHVFITVPYGAATNDSIWKGTIKSYWLKNLFSKT